MNDNTEMDELEKNLPDEFWRKTFEEASEMPPPRVWSSIEQHLDESGGPKVLPLWGTGLASSRPLLWGSGIAAAVALLLVGWWALNTPSATRPLAQGHSLNRTNEVADARRQPSAASAALSKNNVHRVQNEAVAAVKTRSLTKYVHPIGGLSNRQATTNDAQALVAQAESRSDHRFNSADALQAMVDASVAMHKAENPKASFSSMTTASYAPASRSSTTNSTVSQNAVAAIVLFDKLNGKPLRMRRPGSIQRIVWVRPVDAMNEPEISKSKRQPRELWASVSMMPGSFNPMVSVRSVQSSFSNTALAQANVATQPAVNSRANYSVAYQAGAGVQLTERWSVESGIGYLSGHATVETPGQPLAMGQMDIVANRNSTSGNAYVDALRNSSQNSKSASNAPQVNYNSVASYAPVSNQSLQTINNDYQYVQVPVQVGYQLRPRKKLSMAVIGGLLTNIFVKNTVGDALVVTNNDGVYRPVSLAATMGARLRYRPSRQWSASLAGMYQPSLESSTKADAQVQGHPTATGISVGVDYHF